MSRWDRVRCLCPCHGWHCWTGWHRWSGKTDTGGRNGRRQKNNIHLVVFPAIFRLRCVNIRGAKVCKRGSPPLSEMSVPAAFRGGSHKADYKKRLFLFSPCSICVINTPPPPPQTDYICVLFNTSCLKWHGKKELWQVYIVLLPLLFPLNTP